MSTQPGVQYDDYFERLDLGQDDIYFGIDSKVEFRLSGDDDQSQDHTNYTRLAGNCCF